MSTPKKKEEFDIYQGHGDHIECVSDCEGASVFVVKWLPGIVRTGELTLETPKPIAHALGEGFPKETKVFLIGNKSPTLRAIAMVAATKQPRSNEVVSAYPECDGTEVAVKLTAIHEWANGIEATLEGKVLGEARDVAFFDTRYPLHKDSYKIGETYTFRLAAFAYRARFLEEEEKCLRMVGKEAEDWYGRVGKVIDWPVEYDEEGHIKPIEIRMDGMVGFFCGPVAYPDDCEFQSPVFGAGEEFQEFGVDFFKLKIAIARDDEDEDVVAPLVVKKAILGRMPNPDEAIRGRCWLQGYCVDASKSDSI